MTCTALRIALISGLLACSAAYPTNSADLDRVDEALETLQTAVNSRDFSVLEPQLDPSFTYQDRDPGLSRRIMRQVVQGYPHDITGISILSVAAAGKQWSISVAFEGPNGPEQRIIRLSEDYRFLQADIADIQFTSHGERPAGRAQDSSAASLPDMLQFPFEVRKGQIVVQAAINGVPGNFLVDSGAQATTVNTSHFTQEQLSTVELNHGIPSGVGGAIGNVRGVPELQLTWGDLHLENVRGLALDLSHLEASMGIPIVGLIGFNVLERFEIHFDYAEGLLTLYRLDENNRPVSPGPPGTPLAILKFDMLAHIPVIPVRVGGQAVRLGLDSGAAEAMLAEKWQATMSGKFEFVRVAEMRGADKAVRKSTEVRFDSMTVSNVRYEDVVFRFNDIILAGGNTPDLDGLLGYQFLSARPTSMNFRARELHIW